MSEDVVKEVPSSLIQLVRLVAGSFYTTEDALIIDMLVRYPCMKEDDLCRLLEFEKKQLRARIAVLKNERFLQVRRRMETSTDGKAQQVNYYFINYKSFVNTLLYKLSSMRKRLETVERDATSRASFKCPSCLKTFTDLEADQLFDDTTCEFRCTFCGDSVEEDQSALPKKDSRLMLAKLNEQVEQLYVLLRQIEGIKLAPEVLEPEPVDLSTIKGLDAKKMAGIGGGTGNETWSGEATRKSGFVVEEARVDVTIGNDPSNNATFGASRKQAPIWMTKSTVIANDSRPIVETISEGMEGASSGGGSGSKSDDIMSVLLAHEKRASTTNNAAAVKGINGGAGDSDSSDDEAAVGAAAKSRSQSDVELMESDDDDEDASAPTVTVGNKLYAVTEINDEIIATMTQNEKETYIQVFQDYYSHMNY